MAVEDSFAMLKKRLRRKLKDRMDLLQPAASPFVVERLQENIALFLGQASGLWASYRPLPWEAPPQKEFASCGIAQWCYPRLRGNEMEFALGHGFVRSDFGFEQPGFDAKTVCLDEVQGVLIPGLGFDRKGGRLGRGKGFYDRTLAGFQGMKVGIAFSCQILDRVPQASWDLKMDAVITEQFVIMCEGEKK